MLNSLVAVVLGNAAVASLLALGVVLLARWYHKPALLHGLWVVVLLKLVTPPMVSIPVPVEMSALVPEPAPEENASQIPDSTLADVPADTPDLGESGVPSEPFPTIVIEDFLNPDPAAGEERTPAFSPFRDSFHSMEEQSAENPILFNSGEVVQKDAKAFEKRPAADAMAFPATVPPSAETKTTPLVYQFSWRTFWQGMLWVWGLGAGTVFFIAIRQIVQFERSLQKAEPAGDALRDWVARLAGQVGLNRPPEVFLLEGAVSPMLWGFGRSPRLLLPKELLARLNDDAAETLILHELAHMRRGDHWVRVLELLCQGVYWWHPLVWWGRKQLRIVEEECCDAFVVEQCQGGGVYARALVETVDFLSARPKALPPAASGMGNLEFLKRRLTMIMQGGVSARLAGLPKFLLLTAAVVCLSVLPRLVAQTAEKKSSSKTETAPAATEADAPQDTGASDKSASKSAETKPVRSRILVQEPIEFEKKPKGYPSAELEVHDLAFSPDGKLLAAGYGRWDTTGEIVVYDFAEKTVLKKFPLRRGVSTVTFSPDGKYLAVATWQNAELQVRETATWELVAQKRTGTKIARLDFSPDGKYLAAANEAGQLMMWTVGQWDEERAFEGDFFRFQKVAFSPDGKLLVAVGGSFEQQNRFGRGLVFEVESGKQIAKFDSGGMVFRALEFSPDGKEIATGEFGTTVAFWEPRTGKRIASLNLTGTVREVNYAPDGRMAAACGDGTVYVMQDHRILRQMIGHEREALSAVFTPDGKTLATGAQDATIRIWNPDTGVPLGILRPHESLEDTPEAVLAIAHSPDGRFVVTTHEDTSVRLREAATGKFLKSLKGHDDVVSAVAFSPDSKTLATGSYDQTVKLWNVETAELLRTLKGHTNWVFAVAFSPDGKTLASGGYDKSIRLWNVAGGEPKAVLEGHNAAVRSLAFSPDGKQLVSGSSDRTVQVWDLEDAESP